MRKYTAFAVLTTQFWYNIFV